MEELIGRTRTKLLSAIKARDEKKTRLKIFFGMSAGVGKTYAMLKEAAFSASGERTSL